MPNPLANDKVEQVYALMRDGYALLKDARIDEAEQCMLNAWDSIPDPKYDWDISQITVIRIAKFFRGIHRFDAARRWAEDVKKCNPSPGDAEPFILAGSIEYEAGNMVEAERLFNAAFALGGKRGFQGEDPKYLSLVKQPAKPKKK